MRPKFYCVGEVRFVYVKIKNNSQRVDFGTTEKTKNGPGHQPYRIFVGIWANSGAVLHAQFHSLMQIPSIMQVHSGPHGPLGRARPPGRRHEDDLRGVRLLGHAEPPQDKPNLRHRWTGLRGGMQPSPDTCMSWLAPDTDRPRHIYRQ